MDYPYGRQVFDRSRAAPVVTESDGALSALAEYDRARNWADWSGAKSSAQCGDSAVRLSEPHLDRSRLWLHPSMDRDRRCCLRGPPAARRLARQGNTASGIWADTAYRSAANEAVLARGAFVGSHDEILFSPALETKIVGSPALVMLLVLPLRHTWRSAVVSTKRSAQQRQIRHRWSRTWILKQACCDVTNSIRRLQQDNEPLEDGLYSCRFKSRMLSL
jgi:hypothetical protein